MRRLLRLVAWNAGLALAALVLMALAGEAWLRLTKPFMDSAIPMRFVPSVGLMHEPNAEVRWTNEYDFWTVSRANRWGFLDREPPPPDRAAASCHVSLIGDSFVHAKEVPIAEKVQVRLEALAGRRLPHLDVTTSAFGIRGTGPDRPATVLRRLCAAAVSQAAGPGVLRQRFLEQLSGHDSVVVRMGPGPAALGQRGGGGGGEDGALVLRPPDPGYREHQLPLSTRPGFMRIDKEFATVNRRSWLARWLTVERWNRIREDQSDARMREAFGILSRRPGYERLTLHRATKRGVAYTGFALDQFKARTERDGAVLAILATHGVGQSGDRVFDRLHDLAAARGIPVISQRA